MANSLATFPSLLPRITDDLWFTLEKRLDDDAALTKEEEQYTALCKKILDKGSDIPPIGTKKSKDKQERMEEEDDDLEDDDESNDDMEDETDDYESPATPDVESVEGEIEMDSSQI
ncbi:Anaphase-promoting complex subunit 15 [Porites harrisoni]